MGQYANHRLDEMKTISDVSKKELEVSTGKLVHYIAVLGGKRRLEQPKLSTELKCSICDSPEHYTPMVDPNISHERVWICAKSNCVTNTSVSRSKAITTQATPRRALEWPLFCEINGIGDMHHNVKFEEIKQSVGVAYEMRNYLNGDKHFLIFQGDKGTGKTYAAMGLCELFTQCNSSCLFTTQRKMMENWLLSKSDSLNSYVHRLEIIELLVIDDFGTGEIPNGFMTFFMDLINTRIQWKKRKTVLTTNLNNDQLGAVCGDALSDRLRLGIKVTTKGHSRRF